MDSVSAEVNGLLTASVAVDNLYVGGGFGGGTLPDPITVTFGENAALNAENTSSSGGINIGGLIGYNSVGSLDLRGSKLVNKADSALTISAKAIASIHAGGAGQVSSQTQQQQQETLRKQQAAKLEAEQRQQALARKQQEAAQKEQKRQQDIALKKQEAIQKAQQQQQYQAAQDKLKQARQIVKETDAKGSFGVQVALATDQKKAQEITQKLQAAGYKVKTTQTSRGVRIVVGPEKGKVAALALKDKINNDSRVDVKNGWVLYW